MRSLGLPLAAALALMVPAIIPARPAVAVADWRPEVTIAQGDRGSLLADAGYRGRLAVVAWLDAADPDDSLRVAVSGDAGRGAFATRLIARGVEGVAVAACRGAAVVAYRQRTDDGGQLLRLAIVPASGGAVRRGSVRSSLMGDGSVDVACDTGLATVAWTERSAGAWHALTRHVRLSDLQRTPVTDLGLARRSGVAAASGERQAYAAWSDGRALRLKRFAIGGGPSFKVVERPARALTPGGQQPSLGAHGRDLVVGYSDPLDAAIHVSHDWGGTFASGIGFGVVPGRASVVSIGLAGTRMVASIELINGDLDPLSVRLASRDGGRTWRQTMPTAARIRPLDGFLVTAGGTKLAETSIRAGETGGWRLVFRRER